MDIDLQAEGSRLAGDLHQLIDAPYTEENIPSASTLFVLILRGLLLALGLAASLCAVWYLKAQEAFITITCISFSTFGLVVGARKICQLFLPHKKKMVKHQSAPTTSKLLEKSEI